MNSRSEGQIDGLYDAEPCLPLPLVRRVALSGRVVLGPSSQQPAQQTSRYHFDLEELQALLASKALPVTT